MDVYKMADMVQQVSLLEQPSQGVNQSVGLGCFKYF